ncbi:recombinase [Thermoclostridium stercorarium subsp. stercorarium DSM 8532]|jgi:site-specific DNA recombinase|uniref:Recombinase n=2 Tax=Thermoclostridium stercorarium TaxID=1510 RepID=L7VQM8_THES1|nr:recombinase family protein [Thermoclostridium stercorarium]AGC69112.1 recombinase [Thermoclostridium stercorarium subsp. stercorarium DSM 8532]ANW99398.1 recombinase [Thermoclostridium stercorarium subsp. thermolacticum DSM 2910]
MYCIYLRKSRADAEAEARGEGETLARHEKALLELAKKLNITVEKIYREIVSGETIASRPVVQELLSDVEQGFWKGVLVMEVERLARGDTIDQGIVAQTFKYSGTKIITPTKIYDPNNEFDEEYFEFGLFMSRREYKTINRRLQRGRLQSVKEGKYVGNKPPYGYIRKKLPNDKGYTLEPHPEQAEIVKLIFDLYTGPNRIGVSKIVRKLNEMKIPTITGGPWIPSTVQGILRNPVYIGKIRWNSRPQRKRMVNGQLVKERPRAKDNIVIVDGIHEPLISVETWELAQKYLSEHKEVPAPKRYQVKNPLAGLVICGKCGRKMIRRPYTNGQPDTLMCPVTACDNISSYLYVVEDMTLEALKKQLDEYKLEVKNILKNNSEYYKEIEILQKSISNLDKEFETLNKQSNSLHDLLEQGVYSVDTFLERSKIISEKKEANRKERAQLEEKLKEYEKYTNAQKNFIPKTESLIKVYKMIEDPADKNKMLKEVIEKITYLKTDNGRWNSNPEIQLKIYPKLPKINKSLITSWY